MLCKGPFSELQCFGMLARALCCWGKFERNDRKNERNNERKNERKKKRQRLGLFTIIFPDLLTSTVNTFPSFIYNSFPSLCFLVTFSLRLKCFCVITLHGEYILHLFCGYQISQFHFFFLAQLETGISFEISYLEHDYNTYVFLLIRISNPSNRQQEQNMMKLACVTFLSTIRKRMTFSN